MNPAMLGIQTFVCGFVVGVLVCHAIHVWRQR